MSKTNSEFLATLEAIKKEYVSNSLPTQIADIKIQCDAISSDHAASNLDEHLTKLYAGAHKLTGSSGTFGFAEISAVSREICDLIEDHQTDLTPFTPENIDRVVTLTDQLQKLAERTAKQMNDKNADAIEGDNAWDGAISLTHKGTVVVLCDPSSDTLSYANKFVDQEYNVVHIEHVKALYSTVLDNRADVVVIDLKLEGDHVSECSELLKLNSLTEHEVSVVFVASQTDMVARLAAVRAGGNAFVAVPFEDNELMDTIDRLFDNGKYAPYRILIVDNDKEFIEWASAAIRDAGMICEVVTDPIKTLDALASFVPETIIMDISIPDCTGQELANVILQQETFVGTPIMFLSEERRREGRIDVVRHGSYNYMAKPVDIEELITTIRGQAARFRSLRSRMVKDGLTGLNNSTMTRRLLEQQIDNARRTNLPLSFIMIDIDNFKHVNDTYGHAVGDKVLRVISRLLKLRFRSNDVVGRMGGEEFGVVVAGTTGITTTKICDQIRADFAEIQFESMGKSFSCKFSAGVAEFPCCNSSADIMEKADKALYDAKRAGRNNVVLSTHSQPKT